MLQAFQKITRLFTTALLCAIFASPGLAADFTEGTAALDVKFSNQFVYTDANFMLPLFESPQTAAFFINPSAGFDVRLKGSHRTAQRLSIGLGQRFYLPGGQFGTSLLQKGIIAGWNAYVDGQYSMHSNFMGKGGLGIELMSDWVDMRVNGYLRFSEDKDLDKKVRRDNYYGTAYYRDSGGDDHEILRSGVDAEVGVRMPVPDYVGEMRVYGGAYYFDARHTDSIDGVVGRVEWNPIPFITLGAGLTDSKKLHGKSWNAHLGFRIPFSLNAASRGQSPLNPDFTPKTGNLWKDRYTSPVVRNTYMF